MIYKRFHMIILTIIMLIVFALPVHAKVARWVLRDDDTQILILGTVHLLKPGTVWLDAALENDISSADTLYLEITPEQNSPRYIQPLIAQYGILPQGQSLQSLLPAADYQDFVSLLQRSGLQAPQIAQFNQFRPWMAGLSVSLMRIGQLGLSPQSGVEAQLTAIAQRRGMEIKGLETAEEQIGAFASLPQPVAINFLRNSMVPIDKLQSQMDNMTRLWQMGKTHELGLLLFEDIQAVPGLLGPLLINRNKRWVPRIAAILQREGVHVVAVGSGHLAGPDNVIDLLRSAGFNVQQVAGQ